MKKSDHPISDGILLDPEGKYPDYLHDESWLRGNAESISFPQSEDELRDQLIKIIGQGKTITVQGAGTGINGGAVPLGGHAVSTSRMNRILGIRKVPESADYLLRVQAGVLMREQLWPAAERKELDAAGWDRGSLEALDAFAALGKYVWAPDPSEPTITVGGMAANNSKGARSYRHGPVRDYIESIRMVLADGSLLSLKRGEDKARGRRFAVTADSGRRISGELPSYVMPRVKNSAGYFAEDDMDLIDLFIGAEGTLGIITEAEIRLVPAPKAMWGLMIFFPSEEPAVQFVLDLRADGPVAAAIEFLDHPSLNLITANRERFKQYMMGPVIPQDWHTAVYVEFHGDEEEVEGQAARLAGMLPRYGSHQERTWMGTTDREVMNFKQIRHLLPEVVNSRIVELQRRFPAILKLGTDFAVPDDQLEDLMRLYRAGLDDSGFQHLIFGHIGDNNLHVNVIPRNQEEFRRAEKLYRQWAEAVVEMGGTVTAEHGVGKLKRELLEVMFSADQIRQMRRVKSCFDPDGMLNPGNIFAAP